VTFLPSAEILVCFSSARSSRPSAPPSPPPPELDPQRPILVRISGVLLNSSMNCPTRFCLLPFWSFLRDPRSVLSFCFSRCLFCAFSPLSDSRQPGPHQLTSHVFYQPFLGFQLALMSFLGRAVCYPAALFYHHRGLFTFPMSFPFFTPGTPSP